MTVWPPASVVTLTLPVEATEPSAKRTSTSGTVDGVELPTDTEPDEVTTAILETDEGMTLLDNPPLTDTEDEVWPTTAELLEAEPTLIETSEADEAEDSAGRLEADPETEETDGTAVELAIEMLEATDTLDPTGVLEATETGPEDVDGTDTLGTALLTEDTCDGTPAEDDDSTPDDWDAVAKEAADELTAPLAEKDDTPEAALLAEIEDTPTTLDDCDTAGTLEVALDAIAGVELADRPLVDGTEAEMMPEPLTLPETDAVPEAADDCAEADTLEMPLLTAEIDSLAGVEDG